jgi:MtN3 and saliva related transmembrane protein
MNAHHKQNAVHNSKFHPQLHRHFSFCKFAAQIKNIKNMTAIEFVGFSASLLSVLNQFPQAIKVFRSKDTHSISLLMYCIVVVCITMWLIYGILLHDGPLIWANALSLFPIVYIFAMKVKNTVTGKDKLSI